MEFTKNVIDETIIEKLEIKPFSSASNSVCVANMGWSVGPNTFYCTQIILDAVEKKFISEGFTPDQMPQFQVFFNSLLFDDFNILFESLPPKRRYFSAGVPGPFHGRLFPDSSLHFVHSSYALNWLSEVPPEVLDKDSPAWNQGRIHYTSAPEAVVEAYAAQFAKYMGMFLDTKAKELVEGSMMVLILPSTPDGIPHSDVPTGILFNHLGSCLVDLAKEGLVSEALVDSFNIPMYSVTPKEIRQLVERNGCFSIERMEPTDCRTNPDIPATGYSITMRFRAGLEGVITRHFGAEIINELFERFLERMDDVMPSLLSSNAQGSQITVILKRKCYN
ncbi:hypothetical protein GH714_007195 [Hevea brasiliensis]|uniref:Uncharacterized protein n=1 Tax=Hevea brasiliensis TaxID=3981 RepID=A0A6A6LXB4_HEVBR|nr:hypothetical protein GH714_007157 [Hevea brasiliensis]KAF2305641.1 hypothetical protein GH714_007195 [Hevea brasiliensis]